MADLFAFFCASQFLYAILVVKTADEFSDTIYMFFSTFMACCKIVTVLVNHQDIETMTRMLEEKPCKPMNAAEATIQKEFDKRIGTISIYYTILVEIAVISITLPSLLIDLPKRKLLYRAWLPFTYHNRSLYFVAYVHQVVALAGLASMNAGCDVLVIGLCVHACSQQEILKHRLKDAIRKRRPEFGELVRFHDYLYGYTLMIQEKFKVMLGIQLASSTLVVCFNLYQMTNTPIMDPKYLEYVTFMACMTTQSFIYCWYGNELKLKSVEIVEAIFHLDWMFLDQRSKKDLLIIMARAINPFELTCAYVVTMNVDTFVAILKLSYSTYNLLQRTKEA
ncbi:odorant receptor 46a-like isoform X2 [Ptiloglossa arizonensis]|uniref:odorant receptor 46a-like isoform X2 n=1 Tax=Ptiloglossa arizonensis TaxID=3350558 RepID=UPI003FA14AD5